MRMRKSCTAPKLWAWATRCGPDFRSHRIALPGLEVDAIASGEVAAAAALRDAVRELPTPLAVRSSAVGEDSAGASFAGQHITVLNVPSADDVEAAVREVWWSANSDSAITYRKRLGVFARPSVGVVVQSLPSRKRQE